MNYWDKLMETDESAADYMMSYGEGPGSSLRKKLSLLVQRHESILDVGCGPGWNYDHFKQYGPEVDYLGTDYSERFVRVANQRNPGHYIMGDVRKIKAPDKSWDVVLLQDVLEHTNGYEGPLKEALRVAKRIVIVTFWHLTEDDDHININPEENDLDGWGAWYSQPKWEKFLDSLNLKWTHETLPRKDAKHDIYVIEVSE